MLERYFYFFLLIATISFPLAASFDYRVKFVRYWPGLFLGIAVMMLVMVPWDVWFTSEGVWGFNEQFLMGIHIANLPLEEWLFFIAISYACAFVYEVLNHYWPWSPLKPSQRTITSVLILLSFVMSVVYVDRLYTFTAFSLLCLFLLWHLLINRSHYIGQFYLSFLFFQIPFVLVNGALTGLFSDNPIVWYNNAQNTGMRILTIPVEDFGYNMLMLLIVITVLEEFKVRQPTGVLTVG